MNNKIYIAKDYLEKLVIKDSSIEDIQLIYCTFKENVSIINCKIKKASFQSAYFENGLLIKDCEFMEDVDFSMGDHVNEKAIFKLENVVVHGFTSFQDYMFRGKSIFENIKFKKGTNLLGNINTPLEVTFYIEPVLNNVIGELKINDFKK